MKVRKPPALAHWMLCRWTTGLHKDALIGDLIEQYQSDRSGAWYWAQTAITIVVSRTGQIRSPGRKLMRLAATAFAILALGVGTFSWAKTIREAQPTFQYRTPTVGSPHAGPMD
jgi:hypothetical protein